MATFARGQAVEILCEVQPGPFPRELLVTFQSIEGPVSGFVGEDTLRRVDGETGYLGAIVREVSDEALTVLVKGAFFTTTGLAYLARDWANSHVQLARA
jgi:hypothetical protein